MQPDIPSAAVPQLRDQTIATGPLRLRFGVDYTAGNPYQTLMYRAMGPSVDARPATVEEAIAEISDYPGPMIYHLHWEDHALKVADTATAARNVQALIDGLDALVAQGVKVIWTRHNLRSHDAGHHDLHADMLPHLSGLSSVIHLHSWDALDELARHEAFDLEKTVIIGHGSYVGYYDQWVTAKARDSFGFDANAHVFLLFGRLSGYKQVEQTADIFAATDAPHARLVIAGKFIAEDLADLPDDNRIIFNGEYVPDTQVGRYFAAADTVLLPYRDCLTSGTATLAAGFSRGILGTDVAGLRDMVSTGKTGMLYGHGDLASALKEAVKDGRSEWLRRGDSAGRMAALRGWPIFGRQWRDLLQNLARQKPAGDLSQAQISTA